jgi:uncharacterized membrane protein
MRYWLLALILILSFLGISVSWYLAHASVRGGIPLGVFGTGFFMLLFALGAYLTTRPRKRPGYLGLFWTSAAGAIISVLLLLIQGVLAKTPCGYCLVVSGLSLILFVAVFVFHERYGPPKLAVVG